MEHTYKGYTIDIIHDDCPSNPREDWDNFGTMVCWHSRHNLGDSHDYERPEDFTIDMADKDHIILPLYLYDHSGITMSTSSFSCKWDSGQVGYIYVSKEKIKKEGLEDKTVEEIELYLTSEVKTYDNYLQGFVYGYQVINPDGDEKNSCWGFFGDDHENSGLLEYAKNAIDCELASARKTKHAKIKTWIRNRVPLQYRLEV